MMKNKQWLALAALGCLASLAQAQSSVTVFGVVDLAARQIKGKDSMSLLVNEGRSASRFGLRGSEDLGGGMKASFHLESAINPDDGTTDAAFWQRRATVSLSGEFGEIRLGRHKFTDRVIIDEFDPFGTSGAPALTRIYASLGASVVNRADNQIGWHLPAMGGLYGNVEVAAGEGVDANKGVAARIGYKTKAFNVSAAYGQHGENNKLKSTTLGGLYDFGDFVLQGLYTRNERGNANQKIFSLGGSVKLGSQGKLIASFGSASGTGTNTDAKLFGIGYDYSLSKRTTLYTTYARIDNDGTGTFSVSGTKGAAAPAAGGNSTGYEVGVRHTF
jgi:predicted porin